MKKWILFIATILTLSNSVARADGPEDEAVEAYKKGNYAQAMELVRPMAEKGNTEAQVFLGLLYEEGGKGVTKDYQEAEKWYRLAAEQGYSAAIFALGLMYANGEGVAQNYKEAVKWFILSAEKEYQELRPTLGRDNSKGKEVSQDYYNQKAAKWYRRSAEGGYPGPQFALGLMHALGEGAIQDYVLAHMWFNLAASTGFKGAKEGRAWVVKEMTPSQIADAQRMARDCEKKDYKNCD